MRQFYVWVGTLGMFTFGSIAQAVTCPTGSWVFNTLSNCGSNSSSGAVGTTFTSGGQNITIYADQVTYNADGTGTIVNGTTSPSYSATQTVNGLFEVKKGSNGNIASGIGPFDPNQPTGTSSNMYNSQLGIAGPVNDDNKGTNYNNILLLQYTVGTAAGDILAGTTLSFLMQEGLTADEFNVWTGTNAASLGGAGLTETYTDVAVSHNNVGTVTSGGAVNSQFSLTVPTVSTGTVEYIALEADCEYLLLNSITSTPPSSTPEPRFYALLLVSLLAIPAVRRRFVPQQ